MRILHWYSNFLGGGATANAVLGLAEAQARLSAQVSIATAEASQAPLYGSMLDSTSSDIDLIQWKPSWTLKRGNFILRGLSKGTRQALADWRPEVVHIHGEFNADNLRVPALFQCPIVLSPHGAFAPEVFLKSRRAVKSAYFLIATLFLYRHVKTFHALCPMEGEHITKLLPEAKVYQVPEGPNIRVAQAMIAESQARADQTIKLLFVGRLDIFTKGLDLLLEAFAEAESCLEGSSITLTLVGPDWKGSMAWLQCRAQELEIADRVFFTGSLSAQEVSTILHSSDIYIQLSRHEVFSLSVAEALLARKPAILSKNIGALSWPEMASLPHIRLVPLDVKETAKTMIDFAHQLVELRTIAEQYYVKVHEFFSWERVAKLHLRAYQNWCSSC